MPRRIAKQELVHTADIPWQSLKSRELEECLYWLLHSMGARDLEWREGSGTGQSPDSGRDLTAVFFATSPDSDMHAQRWWVEAKGRKKTVEPNAVKATVNSVTAHGEVDVLVVATNSAFSNPTRDWLRMWQAQHPRPLVKLWDKNSLEKLVSEHPDVCFRLFSKALTTQGKLEVSTHRFRNHCLYVDGMLLTLYWNERHKLHWTDWSLMAMLASEFASGNPENHNWTALIQPGDLARLYRFGLSSLLYFCIRAEDIGSASQPYTDAACHLMLSVLRLMSVAEVKKHNAMALKDSKVRRFVIATLLRVVAGDLAKHCAEDCKRITRSDSHRLGETNYWNRFAGQRSTEKKDPYAGAILIFEKKDESCKVGFPLDSKNTCPLNIQDEVDEDFLRVAKTVLKART
jgi:hypothetical protein